MPSPEEIVTSNNYRLILTLEFASVADFVIRQLKSANAVTSSFYILTLTLLFWTLSFRLGLRAEATFLVVLPYTLTGLIILPIVLIPIHEGIHILIFRIFGGRDIRIGVDFKSFIVYVTAHRHVVNSLPFLVIAASPFLIVSILFLLSIMFAPPLWKWTLSLALLVHTTMCAGDIAMAAYYYTNRGKKLLTWDDAERKVAYFFEEIEPADSNQ